MGKKKRCNGGQSDNVCAAALDFMTPRFLQRNPQWRGVAVCPHCGAQWRGDFYERGGWAWRLQAAGK